MDKTKRIAMIVGSAAIGGTEKQIVNLASRLKHQSYECNIVFLNKGGVLEKTLNEMGIEYFIFNFKKRNLLVTFIGILKLIKFFKTMRFDIHYLFLPHAILYAGPILRMFNKNSKIIYGVRGSIQRKNNLFYKMYRMELKKSDLVICNSKAILYELKKIRKIDSSKLRLIYNGVNLVENRKIPVIMNRPQIGKRIVVVANFHSYKGYDLLLDALELINDHSLILTFVGDGPELLSTQARSLNLINHKFCFKGQVQNVSEILFDQDFAVHPSRTEGLSNAILEELSAGLPVIAFDIGGNAELISNKKNGYLIPLGDIEGIASKIKLLVSDKERRFHMSLDAKASVKQFTWEANVSKHIECFEQIS